jgi:hypothetical protein
MSTCYTANILNLYSITILHLKTPLNFLSNFNTDNISFQLIKHSLDISHIEAISCEYTSNYCPNC